ncbi:unnamed protein product [Fraxinus pennsylvanica]|uniref:Uncharacterized protein n=1 Tax=Fraxinus pennsylvanica TaxID=56036 RepID=A0AAD1ZM55_9LAMI|nr:unnamed protein product [Fraxinus pennsylvanica]
MSRYTTRVLKGEGAKYFHKKIEIPYGQTLDIIAMDIGLLQRHSAHFLITIPAQRHSSSSARQSKPFNFEMEAGGGGEQRRRLGIETKAGVEENSLKWRYTTRALKGEGAKYFHKRIEIPYGRTLDIIAMDTGLLQGEWRTSATAEDGGLLEEEQQRASSLRLMVDAVEFDGNGFGFGRETGDSLRGEFKWEEVISEIEHNAARRRRRGTINCLILKWRLEVEESRGCELKRRLEWRRIVLSGGET